MAVEFLEMSESEMNENAQRFAQGLPDRGYQMDNTNLKAINEWVQALQNNEAYALDDAMAFADSLPDK